jgi:rare lipoprotein A
MAGGLSAHRGKRHPEIGRPERGDEGGNGVKVAKIILRICEVDRRKPCKCKEFPCHGESHNCLATVFLATYAAAPQGDLNTMNMTRNLKSVALAIAGVILIPSCASVGNANTKQSNSFTKTSQYGIQSTQSGKASWYSVRTNYGTRTASGQRLQNHDATAAHKTLPMGTLVRVINEANGKSEVVTITDRGPYVKGRIIDVTIGIAERLGFAQRGVAPVRVEVLGKVNADAR